VKGSDPRIITFSRVLSPEHRDIEKMSSVEGYGEAAR